eukprot:Gb_06798 [translate_table: standard]
MATEGKGRHFVLVHGACHGAWCWYKLADLLHIFGHRVTAVDLAGAGINPKQPDDLQNFSEYNQPLMDIFSALSPSEKVILVGHSMGGLSITCAMEEYPHKIAAAVFVAAFMPVSGLSVHPLLKEDIVLAGLLRREFPLWAEESASRVDYTSNNYGRLGRVYIVANEDKIVCEELQRQIIAMNPPDRVYEIREADHSVFFSKPAALAGILMEIANLYS